MPGSSTKTKTRNRDSVVFNTLGFLTFNNQATVGASQAASAILDAITLPCTCKILGASVYYSAIAATTGTHRFNVVAGTGTYITADGNLATDYGTVAGTLHAGDIVTTTFTIPNSLLSTVGATPNNSSAGLLGIQPTPNSTQISVPYTILASDVSGGVGTAATSIATAINLTPVLNQLIYANTAAGQVNFTALFCGTPQNSILVKSIVTGTGATTTFAINAASFAGGTNSTGTVIGVNDQFEYNGAYNFAPAGSGALGATPIFNANMALFQPPVGANPYWSSNFDVVYQKGTILTLRAVTPASTGSITNFKVAVAINPFDVTPPNPTLYSFDPHTSVS